jgi:hypothetical protein
MLDVVEPSEERMKMRKKEEQLEQPPLRKSMILLIHSAMRRPPWKKEIGLSISKHSSKRFWTKRPAMEQLHNRLLPSKLTLEHS